MRVTPIGVLTHGVIIRAVDIFGGFWADFVNPFSTQQNRRMIKARVLLVEDDPEIRILAHEKLEAIGCDVVSARNGEEAIQFLQREPFDIVWSDLEMPKINGLELYRWISESSLTVPIVFFSSVVLRPPEIDPEIFYPKTIMNDAVGLAAIITKQLGS